MITEMKLTSRETAHVLPDEWIDRLFSRFSAMYGKKFLDLWDGCNLKEVKTLWAEDLAGFSGEELKRGLTNCKTRIFPPTLPEFMTFCRPPVDYESLYIGAANALNDGRWKSKLAYWAVQSVGAFEVMNEPFRRMETRWKKAVDELKADGELPDIPPKKEALPAPGYTSICKEEAANRIASIGFVTDKKDMRSWAKKIIDNPKDYPAISLKLAKEAVNQY